MLFWPLFAALLCVAYSRHHKHSGCSRGFKWFDEVCLKTYHYATDYDTAHRKCHHHGSHLIRGSKEELNKMVKKMQTKKMIENTKYWTSSYGLDENSVWFHRFDPKDFAMIMSVDDNDIEERVESRSKLYKFICQKYPRHGSTHSQSKFTELKEKESSEKDQGAFEQKKQHEQTNIEIKEILSEGKIVNELGFEDDEPSTLTSSEASELSSQQSSEASELSSQQSSETSDLSSQQSDLSSQQSSEESDLSSQQSSLESDLSSQQNSGQSSQVSSEFEEIEEESDENPEELWEEQTSEDQKIAEDLEEQTSEDLKISDDLDEQILGDDGPKKPWHEGQTAEDHETKQHGEVSASATAITPAVFLLPLVYIVPFILN